MRNFFKYIHNEFKMPGYRKREEREASYRKYSSLCWATVSLTHKRRIGISKSQI